MVGIVAVTRFCESNSSAFNKYIDYIDRDSATRKEEIDKYNLFDSYLGYMDNDTKTVIDEYKKGTEKVSALFTSSQDILNNVEKKEMKNVFKNAQSNGSNMWQTVISFDNKYLEKIGIYDRQTRTLNEKLLRQASRKSIDKMLEKEGLQNAIWSASFHFNTDNIHIHIATVEPTPMRKKREYKMWVKDKEGKFKIDSKGKKIPILDETTGVQKTYMAYKGVFANSSIQTLKSTLKAELEDNKEAYKGITDVMRGIINNKKQIRLIDNDKFCKKMISLYNDLNKSNTTRNYWRYNQNTLYNLKPQIDDLSNLFINTYHKDDFANLVAKMEQEQERQTDVYGGNNNYVQNKLYNKTDGLYTRLGNTILKELAQYDRAFREISNMDNMDIEANINALEKAAELGNKLAQYKLGKYNLEDNSKEYDQEKTNTAIHYLSQLAEEDNNMYAAYVLGKVNLNSCEPEKINMGIKYLNKAGESGGHQLKCLAYNKLAIEYIKGDKIEKNYIQAKLYLEKSAEAGDEFAKSILENKNSVLYRKLYIATNNHMFYSAIRMIERNLKNDYNETLKNMQEAEILQREIDNRGVEEEL